MRIVKPVVDWCLALVLLLAFVPVFFLVALANILLGLPVIFVHRRPGLEGRLFGLLKFATIHPKTRVITGFSKLLRRTSIDELPQLINILKGEMSFVGPRPLLEEYLSAYTQKQKYRHAVKPGITGLAQVNGRNHLSLDEKVEQDLMYVDRVSFLLDMRILLKTILQLFKFREADAHMNAEVKRTKPVF
ncbi:MAG: sugar transferase [Cyclobacteriaceae bacterium]